ncbi:MAG: NADH:ubiquinone oxidoreductase subunit J [Catenulispora sp. 13_1_20CM_3_70_7]|nr:MAG: NADH:ubiquinone oxidoreductase subunit J [Catenulispora sp. 13_1_20CM_3_70_7]
MAKTSTGEAVQFYVLGVVAVLGALGMVLSKKAVHSALSLAATMICLAMFYLAQGAYFLGVVQIVVYTGAIMMLFLFVLMLVGVSSADSLVETIKGQRKLAVLAGVAFAVLIMVTLGHARLGTFKGAGAANAGGGNVKNLADLIFSKYFWAFEVTSALLITAAVGAMVLTHRERLVARKSQKELVEERVRTGKRMTPLPTPGVYARHNAVDIPALLPDGSVAEDSVNATLVARTPVRDAVGLTAVTRQNMAVPRQGDAPELENASPNGAAE